MSVGVLADRKLVKGKTVGLDATTLEANPENLAQLIEREAEQAPAKVSLHPLTEVLVADPGYHSGATVLEIGQAQSPHVYSRIFQP